MKQVVFEDKVTALAAQSKALAHPARLLIIKSLMDNNHQTCQMLVDQLPYSQSTVSQHLAELKQAGFIDGKSYKTAMIYSAEEKTLKAFRALFDDAMGLKVEKKQLSLF